MDKSIKFRSFSLLYGPCFDLHDHQICILKKKLLILTANCMVIFTLMEAKYTHMDNSIPVWQQLYPRIQLMLKRKCKVFFFMNCKGTIQRYEQFFAWLTLPPPLHLDPGCHFDMFCECVKRTCWQKGILGHGGGTHPKINYKALMKHFN